MHFAEHFSRILLVVAFVIGGFTSATAQVEAPGKPIEFGAKVVENGTMVKLSWMASREGGEATSFCIFYAEGETENMDDFELLKETDSRPVQGLYSYLVQDLDPGTYTFYVVAKNDGGDSPRSIIKVVTLEEEDEKTGAPGKPVEVSADVIENGRLLKLRWQTNKDGGTPTSFCIFYAEGETENLDDFELLKEVEAKPNSLVHEFVTDDLEPGVYSFYIVAKNADGESVRSIIKVVEVGKKEEPKVWIVSKPEKGAKEGATWNYQVRIETNFKAGDVTYILKEGPDGMEIDAKTGKVTWKEPVEGRYEIKICVEVEFEGRVIVEDQSFVLEVGDGKNEEKECAAFFGSVKDENGETVRTGTVTAWMTRADNSSNELKRVHKTKIEGGRYVMHLPAGSYLLLVEGEDIVGEWYENATSSDDATTIEIACNEEKEVNFVVAFKAPVVKQKITGRVYDAETNEGIHNALIVFEYAGGEKDRPRSEHKRVVTESDQDGNYEAMVAGGVAYVAHAVARTPNVGRDMYLAEWWENTHDASQATRIVADVPLDGIDFSMDKKEVVEGGFSGRLINNETNVGVTGKVIAYMHGTEKNSEGKRHIQSVETDADGYYTFTNLPSGRYLAFGIPAERPMMPGWYVANDVASHTWKEASVIEVNDAMVALQHDILLTTAKEEMGRGNVRGWVFDKRTGFIGKGSDKVQDVEGVHGALVTALDATGNVVDFALTTADGSYDLTNLPIGVTTLVADRIDFNSEVTTVELTESETSGSVSVGLLPVVTSVEVPTNNIGVNGEFNLYPNPASSNVTVRFPSSVGTATIVLISAQGTVLSSQEIQTEANQTTVNINTNNLPQGVLMVRIENNATTVALPLSIVR